MKNGGKQSLKKMSGKQLLKEDGFVLKKALEVVASLRNTLTNAASTTIIQLYRKA